MIGLIAHLVLLGTGCLASIVFPNPDPAARKLTLFGGCVSRARQEFDCNPAKALQCRA
jgi:hypothetical protein